jgi:hypothetical protein
MLPPPLRFNGELWNYHPSQGSSKNRLDMKKRLVYAAATTQSRPYFQFDLNVIGNLGEKKRDGV